VGRGAASGATGGDPPAGNRQEERNKPIHDRQSGAAQAQSRQRQKTPAPEQPDERIRPDL
jgi:hypothetical protein